MKYRVFNLKVDIFNHRLENSDFSLSLQKLSSKELHGVSAHYKLVLRKGNKTENAFSPMLPEMLFDK